MRDRTYTGLWSLIFVFTWIFVAFTAAAQEKRYSVPIGDSPVLGPPDAPVTIIEFLDYQ